MSASALNLTIKDEKREILCFSHPRQRMEISTFGQSHMGLVRNKNEDRFLIRKLNNHSVMLAIIDGLGGQPAGEYAAQRTAEILAEFQLTDKPVGEQLINLIEEANRILLDEGEQDPEKEYMGCTITAAVICSDTLYWIHVGDCRLYLFRNNTLEQMTIDQNMAQFLVDEGQITAEEAKHSPMQRMLDQSLGNPYCEPAGGEFSIQPADALYLFTDGIHDEISSEKMLEIISSEQNLQKQIERLIQGALDAGGRDNCTGVAAKLQ